MVEKWWVASGRGYGMTAARVEALRQAAAATAEQIKEIGEAMEKLTNERDALFRAMGWKGSTPPAADPRERALQAKQSRGTGPEKVLPRRRDYRGGRRS